LSLRAEWIFEVDFWFILLLNEIISKFLAIGQTLQSRIHETSVAQILEADKSMPGGLLRREIEFFDFDRLRTLLGVVKQVFVLALSRAVEYLVARAFVFWESYFFTTELAWLIFFEFI
jgi:hypothetical protein